jgi:hypothetical protein
VEARRRVPRHAFAVANCRRPRDRGTNRPNPEWPSLVKGRMTLWRDLRHGARVLWRAPGFTALAVVILALGIGATTAIFSLFDAAMLRALPYREPDALVMLWEAPPDTTHNRVAPLNYVDWSEQNQTFSAMAAIAGAGRTLTRPGALPERIAGQSVTTRFFDVLGVVPSASWRRCLASHARRLVEVCRSTGGTSVRALPSWATRRPTRPTNHRRTTRSRGPPSSTRWVFQSSAGAHSALPTPSPRSRCAWSARHSSGAMPAAAILSRSRSRWTRCLLEVRRR